MAASPGVDAGTFPAGLIAEMLRGIVEAETSLVDEIFTPYERTTLLSGNITIDGSESGLARGENQHLGAGVDAKEHKGAIGSVAFDARAYVGKSLLTDEAANNFEALDEDAMNRELKIAYRDANTALDRYAWDSVLASTSKNVEADVTNLGFGDAAWDDGGTASTPVQDIRHIIQVSAPGADTGIIGRAVANGLMIHPDVVAELSNFSAGTEDEDGLKAWLKRKFGLRTVHIIKKLYNAAGVGSVTPTYIGDTVAWFGHAADLINVHPQFSRQDSAETFRLTSRSMLTQVARYDDPIRPTQTLGAIATNVTS